MSILVAEQSHFESMQDLGVHSKDVAMAIPRCRCQPNTCTRPVCKGCVQCLRNNDADFSNSEVLTEFFAN